MTEQQHFEAFRQRLRNYVEKYSRDPEKSGYAEFFLRVQNNIFRLEAEYSVFISRIQQLNEEYGDILNDLDALEAAIIAYKQNTDSEGFISRLISIVESAFSLIFQIYFGGSSSVADASYDLMQQIAEAFGIDSFEEHLFYNGDFIVDAYESFDYFFCLRGQNKIVGAIVDTALSVIPATAAFQSVRSKICETNPSLIASMKRIVAAAKRSAGYEAKTRLTLQKLSREKAQLERNAAQNRKEHFLLDIRRVYVESQHNQFVRLAQIIPVFNEVFYMSFYDNPYLGFIERIAVCLSAARARVPLFDEQYIGLDALYITAKNIQNVLGFPYNGLSCPKLTPEGRQVASLYNVDPSNFCKFSSIYDSFMSANENNYDGRLIENFNIPQYLQTMYEPRIDYSKIKLPSYIPDFDFIKVPDYINIPSLIPQEPPAVDKEIEVLSPKKKMHKGKVILAVAAGATGVLLLNSIYS